MPGLTEGKQKGGNGAVKQQKPTQRPIAPPPAPRPMRRDK